MSIFDIIMNKFFKNLVDNYQYDMNILETEWIKINNEIKTSIKIDTIQHSPFLSAPPSTPVIEPIPEENPSIDSLVDGLNNLTINTSTSKTDKCIYKITRGTNANTTCNLKVKSGHTVCTKHIRYENQSKKSEKTIDKNKPRTKLTTKQVSIPGNKLDFLNTCKSLEEESQCINFDELQVHEINKMFKDVLDSSGNNEYKDKNLTLEEIFWDKKRKLVEYYKEKQPIKITFTKWNQIEHSLNDVISFRTKNDVILNLVRYKQSKYYVDKNSLVIVKSLEEPLVIGRINRYEQPTLEIDGYTYDLILKYNFEFDLDYLNNEGKEAHEAFLKSKSMKGLTPIIDNSIPEENKKFI